MLLKGPLVMTPTIILLLLMLIGAVLWQAPAPTKAPRLNDLGKWMAVLAYAAWLWGMVA